MSLNKVIEEIKQVKPFAEEDVETGARETLAGRRGRKNAAIERLKTLRFEYRQSLIGSAAFIVVTGEKRDAFASIASEEFSCFASNPNEFFEDLASRIPAVLYQGRESVSNLFDILGRHLEDKANELGVVEYPQLIFRQQYRTTLKSKEDLVSLIKQAVTDQMGSEIVGIQAVNSLLNTAIDKGHGAKITPIVLSTGDEGLALSLGKTLSRLKPKGVFLVVAGKGTKALRTTEGVVSIKDPTKEAVEETLKSISERAKK